MTDELPLSPKPLPEIAKPCPFCGREVAMKAMRPTTPVYYISCEGLNRGSEDSGCGYAGPFGKTKADAVIFHNAICSRSSSVLEELEALSLELDRIANNSHPDLAMGYGDSSQKLRALIGRYRGEKT